MRIAEDENKRVLVENGKLYLREELQTTRIFGTDNGGGYLYSTFRGKWQGIHRHIYETFTGLIPKGYVVDHKFDIKTDNRLSELQLLTYSENNAKQRKQKNNTSKIIGVHFDTSRNKWEAQNRAKHLNGGKNKHIGRFDTKEEAGLARDAYVIENHLNFHTLNYPSCRLEPLDEITPQQNYVNRQKKNNQSGIIGVSKDRNRWRAQNQSTNLNNGKKKHIGLFNTKGDAGLARDAYVINNHLEYYPLNYPSCRLEPPSAQ